jgi:hypothetical protein
MAEACHESPEITAPTTPKRCSRTFVPRYLQGASTCDSIPTVATTIEERFPRPSVMGVVNVTPDSFSDGGANFRPTTQRQRRNVWEVRRSWTSAANRRGRGPRA